MMQKAEANKESGKENGRFARKPAEQTATAEPSLQQMLGNRAIGRLTIQRKMTVNAVGDKYEQEADAVAKAVVQTLNAPQPAQRQEVEDEELPAAMAQRQMSIMRQETPPEEEEPLQMKPIQRQEAAPEEEELQLQRQEDEEELQAQRQEAAPEEEEPLQMKAIQRQEAAPEEEELQAQRQEAAPEEEEPLQMKAIHQSSNLPISQSPISTKPVMTKPTDLRGGGPVDDHIASRITQAQGGGSPLADTVRQPMEQAFGTDFSHVRIHTNSEADTLNQSLQARAFTTGQDIFFRQGEYNSSHTAGQELLAHELTHVVQQTSTNSCRDLTRLYRQEKLEKNKVLDQAQKRISTPLNSTMKVHKGGRVSTSINNIKIIILPDRQTKNKGLKNKAETKFEWKLKPKKISYRVKNNTITKFSLPKITVKIWTVYGPQAKPIDKSAYGRGTTKEDQAQGNTSLGFHEGHHGQSFLNYLSENPLPAFKGNIGLSVSEFQDSIATFNNEVALYFKNLEKFSKRVVDCVGDPASFCEAETGHDESLRGQTEQADASDAEKESFRKAKNFFENGNYRKAILEFDSLYNLSSLPENAKADLIFNIGLSNLRLYRFATAIMYFEQYLTFSNSNKDQGEHYLNHAREKVLQIDGESLNQDDKSPQLKELFLKGTKLFNSGQFRKAIIYFERVRQLTDLEEVILACLHNIGKANMKLERFVTAQTYFAEYDKFNSS